jgi:hypothetical protein
MEPKAYTKTIFIRDLPDNFRLSQLLESFKVYGDILQARIIKNQEKRSGVVVFDLYNESNFQDPTMRFPQEIRNIVGEPR